MLSTAVILSWAAAAAESAAGDRTNYKCLFNHELLIVSHRKDQSPGHIQSFVEKLKDTDVDAVMCCPTLWRTNFFPSQVDPGWKRPLPEKPSKFKSFDYAMRYLQEGGDPVKETLEACRRCNKAFFVSYRMNDHHYVADLEWPTHNAIWREHPEYWLGDTGGSPASRKDHVRVFNYLLEPVRAYYFAIIEELCVKYDVDGVELDFQRFPRFFHDDKIGEGTPVMTAFVGRIKARLDQLGRERGKLIPLCVRVPETIEKCRAAGLDVPGWDQLGLIDMINVSSFYVHSTELDIEGFRAATKRASVYGEMNFVTYQAPKNKSARRYTTPEIYRATAFQFLSRGADGLSLFNFDYVPEAKRLPMTGCLKGITDPEQLRKAPKNYVITRGFGSLPATNEKKLELIVADDSAKVRFERSVLRVETRESCEDLQIAVSLNGQSLEPCLREGPELFAPLADNAAYPHRDNLKFFAVPTARLVSGKNRIELLNLDKGKRSCSYQSLELALYPKGSAH